MLLRIPIVAIPTGRCSIELNYTSMLARLGSQAAGASGVFGL